MADHPGVELLGALAGLAPLEVADGVRAAGHGLEGPEPVETARLGVVHPAPVDRSRRLFHQHPGAARLGTGQVLHECPVLGAQRVARIGVEVDGDDVLLLGPAPGVLAEEERHEVGGDRDVRGVPGDDVTLGEVALQKHVGGEAPEVQHLSGVLQVVGAASRENRLPAVVALAPEVRAPGGVEGVQGAVLLAQPAAEGDGRLVAVIGRAVLVVDVPHREGGVAAVAGGQVLGDGGGVPSGRWRWSARSAAVRPTTRRRRSRHGAGCPGTAGPATGAGRRWGWRGRRRCRSCASGPSACRASRTPVRPARVRVWTRRRHRG